MQKTKIILAEALKKMLETKALDKITIRNLVEECEVNRQTFYYYFHDIYELLECMVFIELDKMLKHLGNINIKDEPHLWQRMYFIILSYLYKNKVTTIKICHSIGRERLENVFHKMAYYMVIMIIEYQYEELSIDTERKEFIANFYGHAFVGITLDWINSLMNEEPEAIVSKANYLICGGIKKEQEILRD